MHVSSNGRKFEIWGTNLYGGLVGALKDRIIERTQGCWNCKNWQLPEAKKLWWDRARPHMLEKAVAMALASKEGEEDVRVRNIRTLVAGLDKSIEDGLYGVCKVDGGTTLVNAPPNQLGNFVPHQFLCPKWTGVQGASIARAGQAPDILPDELQDRFDQDRPANLKILKPNPKASN